MVFSSSLFLLLFFPVFFLGYYFVPYRFKNSWALLASLVFYAWGAPLFVFALVASVGVDYALVRLFHQAKYRKKALWLGVIFNTALLAYFKYANFLLRMPIAF